MKAVLGDEVGLALDCGPGWMVSDAIRFAKASPYELRRDAEAGPS